MVEVQWYLDVYVNDTLGSPVNQANVTGWNVTGIQKFSELTASNGYISTKTLTEYMQNRTSKYYQTNYTVNATKGGYTNATKQVNLTSSQSIYLTLFGQAPPIYSLNSTNSTLAGTPILHSLNWTDSNGLSGYIFSFYNGSNSTGVYNWTSSNLETGTKQFKGFVNGTGWEDPTNNAGVSGSWAFPTQAYSNGDWTTVAYKSFIDGTSHSWYDYSFGIPTTSRIIGIQVRADAYKSIAGTGVIGIEISNNSGTSWSSTGYDTGNLPVLSETTYIFGGTSDLWGLNWSQSTIDSNLRTEAVAESYPLFGADDLEWIPVNITYGSMEENKSWVEYTNFGGNNYDNVDQVQIIATIDSYDPRASSTNNRPDLEIGIWNSSAYINNSFCHVNNTMGNNALNTTDWNCTITSTAADIRNAWRYQANRSVIIRGIFFDANLSYADEINVTGVYGHVDAWNSNSLINDTWVSFGAGTWSNVTKTVNSTVGATIRWCVYANDTSNNWNGTSCSNPFSYLTGAPPTYSLNSTNSTIAGTPISHNLYWQDNNGLSGYIFQFCNGTWNGSNCINITTSTTTLSLNYTYDLADIGASNTLGTEDLSQIMWNITTIPAGVTIIDAKQCLYWSVKYGSPNNNVNVSRINDHTWTESSSATTIKNQQLTNSSSLTWNSTTQSTWGCTNVTTMLQTDYNLGYKNASFRFEDPDNPVGTITSTWDGGLYALLIGGSPVGDELEGNDREGTDSSSNRPILIITYSSSGIGSAWVNDTWVPMTGIGNWSNVTKVVNSTIGATIAWCIYANDTSNNWNGTSCTNPFSYQVTSSSCQVYIDSLPYNITQNNTYYCLSTSSTNLAGTAIQFGTYYSSSSRIIQNSTLDCQGNNLDGDDSGTDYGINMTSSNTKNNTVKNCNIADFHYGIYLTNGPNNNTLTNITANNNTHYGIYIKTSSNNTLTNITSNNNTDNGIYLESSSNNTLTNITSNNNTDNGIYLYNSSDNNLTSINITTSGSSAYGILLNASSDNNLTSINITTSGSSARGIYLLFSSNATLTNNNITVSTSVDGGLGLIISGTQASEFIHQIDESNKVNNKPVKYYKYINNQVIANNNTWATLIVASSNNITITNITTSPYGIIQAANLTNSNISFNRLNTTASYAFGIYIYSSSNNTISNNNITTSGDTAQGIYININTNSTISNNNITTSGGVAHDIYLVLNSNNTISNNNITTSGSSAHGIKLDATSNNNTLTNNNITTTHTSFSYGIYFYDSDANNVSNTTITTPAAGSSNDIYIYGANLYRNYIINSTFNQSDVGFDSGATDRIEVQWYLGVYVNNTFGNPINQANVTGWNVTGNQKFSELTASNGYISTKTLTEYMQNRTNKYYQTNYTVNATKSGYGNDTKQVNLTQSKSIYLTLQSYISVEISQNLSIGILFTNRTGSALNTQYNVEINNWNNGTWNYNSANGQTEYWIKNTGTDPEDFCINATSALSCTGGACSGQTIPINNVSFNNATSNDVNNPSYDTSKRLNTNYVKVGYGITPDASIYLRFWLFVPTNKPSGTYNTTFAVRAVTAGSSC
jgi:parallel beta-helix repeat protein